MFSALSSTVPILFGWAFTVAASYAAGYLLLRLTRVVFYREEEHFFRFIIGSGCYSLLIFLLTAANAAYQSVFLACGGAVIAVAISRRRAASHLPLPDFPWAWKLVFVGTIALFGIPYFLHALGPEYSPDGSTYHLGIVGRYLRQHGFGRITNDMYANLSEAIEMLFLCAYSIGKHSSAALVEFTFLLALPFGILSYCRRIGRARAGVLASLLVYASPVVGMSGTIAYNDVAGMAILFAMFYLLQIWRETGQHRLVPMIGLTAGYCYASKYTLFLALPFAGLYLLWYLVRNRQAFLRPLFVYSAVALLLAGPWLLKNWIIVDNPFSPFANRLFPNQYITIHFEEEYSRLMRDYVGLSISQRTWDHVAAGAKTSGLLGPVFLLAPLALLALKSGVGRQALLAAGVFLLPAYTNIETRFLLPMLPFVALALGFVLTDVAFGATTVLAFHLFASWPANVRLYADRSVWALTGTDVAEAFRFIPEEETLRRRMPAYDIARMIEKNTPPEARVLSFSNPPEAYTSREILVKYESAEANYLGELFWAAQIPEYQPLQEIRFDFSAEEIRAIRLVQTGRKPDDMWSISELRVLDGSTELRPPPSWKFSSSVNSWGAAYAFDGNSATRWISMEPAKAGMYLSAEFGKAEEVSAVIVRSPIEGGIQQKLEVFRHNGWQELPAVLTRRLQPVPEDFRRQAESAVKQSGISHILVGSDDFGAQDFISHEREWGIELVGSAQGKRLYRLL